MLLPSALLTPSHLHHSGCGLLTPTSFHKALNMLGLYTDLGGDHKQFGLLTNDRDHLDEDKGVEADPDDGEDEGEETRGQGVR